MTRRSGPKREGLAERGRSEGKESGYGRENGIEVIREHTQVKNVWVELSGATADPFKIR